MSPMRKVGTASGPDGPDDVVDSDDDKAEADGGGGKSTGGGPGGSAATQKPARKQTLNFMISSHTSRIFLYDTAGESLGANIPLEDAIAKNAEKLPATLQTAPCRMAEVWRYVRRWPRLNADTLPFIMRNGCSCISCGMLGPCLHASPLSGHLHCM
jgi:hypothetical protein